MTVLRDISMLWSLFHILLLLLLMPMTYATLSGLLSAGKIKEAEEYLAGVEQKTDVLSGQFCPNPYINATLAYYDRKLAGLSASCRMDIQLGEEELPYMELCQILACGLENVCDALKKQEAAGRLDGEMFCYTEDGYFILDVMVSRRAFPNTE